METAGKETPPKHSRRLSYRLSGIAGRNCAAPHPVPLWSADHHESVPGRVRRESSFGRFPGPGVLEHLRRGDRSLGRPAWDGGNQPKLGSEKPGARSNENLPVRCECRAIPLTGRMGAEGAQARGSRLFDVDRARSPQRFFLPMPALISAAEATKNLRVGTNVLNNDFRHPVLVAREAATADLLTEGRFELGLGAGHMQSEYNQAGLNFDAGGIRVERLAEAVVLIKRLLKGEQVTLAGHYYRVTGHTIYPLPVQRPHPPILVGGNGLG